MKRLAPLLSLAALRASAQCVMCFRTAEAQNLARARILNTGILMLGIPPFLILGGFCWLMYRRSRTYATPADVPVNTLAGPDTGDSQP